MIIVPLALVIKLPPSPPTILEAALCVERRARARLPRARNFGGAILAAGDSTVSSAAVLEGNAAGGHGGGIATLGSASVAVGAGSAFVRNDAGGSGGGAYFGGGPVLFGERCTPPNCCCAFPRFATQWRPCKLDTDST
jgi:hypothetical protein